MEFPVIFLGASPKDIPAMYSLMNYGGYALGTWYPMDGFYELILAMKKHPRTGALKTNDRQLNSDLETLVCREIRCQENIVCS